MSDRNKPIRFGEHQIQPGEKVTIALPMPQIYTCAPMYIPIHVLHGKKKGPCLVVCSSLHGDEMNGLVIIQRLIQQQLLKSLSGTLIAIPVVNIYGLTTNSKTLPDGKSLDKSFPGSEKGTFTSRLAHHLTNEIFDKADYCIDIRSGDPNYSRLPQIRTNLNFSTSKLFAKDFHAPILLHTETSEGMLWMIKEKNIPTLIYQTGEALRLDERGIRTGRRGILKIMRSLNMLKSKVSSENKPNSWLFYTSKWIHSPLSGLCQIEKKNGSYVKKGDLIFRISDPFGTQQNHEEYSSFDGIVIAQNNLPLVNEGDVILQIALFDKDQAQEVKSYIDTWKNEEMESVNT